MTAASLPTAVDHLATERPGQRGYGYADSQPHWRHDPAIEQPRAAFLAFLAIAAGHGRRGTWLQIGLGRHGGSHRAFRLLARRVITIERDERRVAAFLADDHDADDVLLTGDAGDAMLIERVRAAAAGPIDVLFLDGDDTYEGMRAAWEIWAPLVRTGGIVAFADQAQAWPGARRAFDVDRFALDLERDFLQPLGARLQHLGGARAIHWYGVPAHAGWRPPLPWPADFAPTAQPVRHGTHLGFAIHAHAGGFVATPADAPFSERALLRNEPGVVLCHDTVAGAAALVEAWTAAAPRLAEVRALLACKRLPEAHAAAAALERDVPDLYSDLVPGLQAAPHCRALLLAIGTLALFAERRRQGVALLRRALEQDPLDRELVPVLGNVCLHLLRDGPLARELLDQGRRHLRQRQVADVCRSLGGFGLWSLPTLLRDVRSVLQVGAHVGEEVAAFARLGWHPQAYVEPQPQAFARLREECARNGVADAVLLPCAVGAAPCERELRLCADTAGASLLPTHPLADLPAARRQTGRLRVQVETLDGLVAQGRLDASRCDLLVVDTEGSELDVLRGARELLRHVDVVCVAVIHDGIYEGAPLLQQLSTFLWDLHDGDGFRLRACELGRDPRRGDAVYTRRRRRSV